MLRGGILALAMMVFSTPASAALSIIATEERGNVVFSFLGDLDLTGLVQLGSGEIERREQGFIKPREGSLVNIPFDSFSQRSRSYDRYESVLRRSFGGFRAHRGNAAGDPFGVTTSGHLLVPEGYQSGSEIRGTLTYFGADFSALGIEQGTETFLTLSSGDFISMRIGPLMASPVPLPSASLFMAGSLGALATRRRKARR